MPLINGFMSVQTVSPQLLTPAGQVHDDELAFIVETCVPELQ
jgi:hypothetical protein